MDELEPLATALRQELGEPPEAWKEAQRARFRERSRAPAGRSGAARFAPWVVASVAVAAALILLVVSRRPAADERWLVAEELKGPVALDDGSKITLGPGARGRLLADATSVRFDLHQGRASFDVVPERKRQWTINAGKNEVRVVGTRFSVFYGAGEAFEVNVERGVVAVQVPDRHATLELKAGDHLHGLPERMEVARTTPSSLPPESQVDDAPAPPATSAPPDPAPASPPGSAAAAPSAAKPDWQLRYREGKYAEAVALIRAGGVAKHLADLSAGALADLAEAARLGGDPELAVRALTTLLQRFPGSPEARDGRFLLGRVHVLRGDTHLAIEDFDRYLRGAPSGRYANEARGRLMELYSARGEKARARELARQYLDVSPDGPYRRLAKSLVAAER